MVSLGQVRESADLVPTVAESEQLIVVKPLPEVSVSFTLKPVPPHVALAVTGTESPLAVGVPSVAPFVLFIKLHPAVKLDGIGFATPSPSGS